MALGKRLLSIIVQEARLKKPFKQCPFELVNTIIDGAERAVNFLSRDGLDDENLEKIRNDYIDALVSVFAVRLQPDPVYAIMEGVHEFAPEEVEGRWYAAALLGASYLGRTDDMKCFMPLVDGDEDTSKFHLLPFVFAAAALGGHMGAVNYLSGCRYIDYHWKLGSRKNMAMHFAALGGHTDVIAFLLEKCDYWYLLNDWEESPLLWAVCIRHTDAVRQLILKDVPHIGTGRDDRHMLTWAVEGGFEDVVIELLKHRGVSVMDSEGGGLPRVSVLALAAAQGRENIFQLLYADPTADKADIGVVRGALIGENLNIVRTVLDPLPGILPRYDEACDTTAIIEVAQSRCSEELLRYMLSRNDVDVNHPCDGTDTVLRAAIRSRDMGKFRAVLDHPDLDINQLADYNVSGRGTVLDITLWDIDMDSPQKLPYLKALIARPDMNVNYPGDSHGSTAFGAAALGNSTEVMQLLLERDDLDRVPIDELNCTPLLLAAESNAPEALELLLTLPETLLDVWHRNNDGRTALECSAALGNVEIVRRLLDPALGATREVIQDAIDGTEAEMLDPSWGGDGYMERAQSILEILRERIKEID